MPSIEQEIRDLHTLFGSPADPEGRAFVPLADAYRRAGDPSRSIDLLEQGLSSHPELVAAHVVAGWARRDLADDVGAESAFRRALELDGDNARALVGLGRLIARREGADAEEGMQLLQRGFALDPRLESEGTPDRVPRHSGASATASPDDHEEESVEAMDPMEWEVLGDSGEEEEGFIIPAAAEEDLLRSIEPNDLDLDIEWEEESFYAAESDGADDLQADEDNDTEIPVVDAASLAPDDWQGSEEGDREPDDASDDLLMDLADLAPDIEPARLPPEPESAAEALPTRTLGELYARQGLLSEAVKVFRDLCERDPDDEELRARLSALQAEISAPRASARAEVDPSSPPSDETTIATFLGALLAWEPERATPGSAPDEVSL